MAEWIIHRQGETIFHTLHTMQPLFFPLRYPALLRSIHMPQSVTTAEKTLCGSELKPEATD